MKRVLIVAYYFPPIATSGSMRPLGFCRYLEEHGWLPQILTTDVGSVYPPQAVDDGLSERLPATVHVTRVGHANPAQNVIHLRNVLRRKMRSLGRQKLGVSDHEGNVPTATEPSLSNRWMTRMKDHLWDWLFRFPDPQWYWLRPAVRWMSKLPCRDYPDVVLATGSPWTGLLVGRELAKRFGVPFIADFRDPWFDNPNKRGFSSRLLKKTKKLERLVLLSAAKVVANTPELCYQFQGNNQDLVEKFVTISNGFDIDERQYSSIGLEVDRTFPQEKQRGLGLELCHFGSVYWTRSPLPLLTAMNELYDEKIISSKSIRVRFVGAWEVRDNHGERLAQTLEDCGVLVRTPTIPHHLCLEQMKRADVLLILQPGFPFQVPGKIYEYLALKKPMLVIGGEGATSALVTRHQWGHCCSNDVLPLKAILSSLVSNPDAIAPPSDTVIGQFHYRSLTRQLADVLDEVSRKD